MAGNKEKWAEAIKKKNPSKKYEDEDELYADAMSGYDETKGRLTKFEEDNKRAMDVLQQNPDVQNFLAVILSGGDLGKAMSYLPNGDMSEEDKASYKAETERRAKSRKEAEDKEASRMANYTKSAEALKAWAEENGRSVETMTEAIDGFINKVLSPLDSGELTPEFFECIFRLHNYDNDVKASHEAGVIDGRNLAAGERAARRKQGDGLPALSAGGESGKEQPRDGRSNLIDSIARMNKKQNIFR